MTTMLTQGWRRVARLPAGELKALQNLRLHRYLNRYLYPFSPHYKDLLDRARVDPRRIRRVEDLRHLPFTTKRDLLPTPEEPHRFRRFILQPDAAKLRKAWPLHARLPLIRKGMRGARAALRREFFPIFMTFTTGRSADPVPFLYTDHDLRVLRECGKRLVDVLGVGPDTRTVNLFPYAPHLAFWQVTMAGFEAGILILGTGGGRVMGTVGNIRAMARLRAEAVLGVPGYLYHLLRVAAREGAAFPDVRTVVLGAERVPPGLKQKMREILGEMGARDVQVLSTYGFTEARMAMAQCPTGEGGDSGYHLYPDLAIFEVVDPSSGEVLGPGETGELVFTPLAGRGSCVLRYRTGDLVQGGIRTDPCPHCGRTVPRISPDITRVSSVKDLRLMKIKGTLVNLEDFGQVLSDMPQVEEWQVELAKKDNDPMEMDQIILYVALKEGVDRELCVEEIRSRLRGRMEVAPNAVHVMGLDEMLRKVGMETEMKEKRFVDSRPVA